MRLDARSLALHSLVACKVLKDPTLIAEAHANLRRWKKQATDPVPSYFAEWERILRLAPQQVAGFLVSMSEASTRLRQSSPFATLLTPDERSRVYAAFQ